MSALPRELVHAVRAVLRRPGLLAAVAATLALAIAVNTAMFGVVHAVLLRPLPFPDPQRIVRIEERHAAGAPVNLTGATFSDLRAQARSFSHAAAYRVFPFNLSGEGDAVAITAARVSADFFFVLGARPLAGRFFAPGEFEPGGERTVVLGERLWRSFMGGDPGAVGRRVKLDGEPHLVVGVVAERERFPDAADLWLPLSPARLLPENRRSHLFTAVARVRPGVSLAEARGELASLAAGIGASARGQDELQALVLTPLGERLTQAVRPALAALSAAVGLALLVACANVASLLLARGAARERELAVRAALGASRLQIVRQLLLESLVLAAFGTLPGVLLAGLATQALRALAPPGLPRADEIALDGVALAHAVAIGLGSALLFGLGPALRAARGSGQGALARGARGVVSPSRARAGLVVAQIALLVVVLGGAGLLARSFLELQAAPLGFRRAGVFTFYVSPAGPAYGSAAPTLGYVDRVLEELRGLPGARQAAAALSLPSRPRPSTAFALEGRDEAAPDGTPMADVQAVSASYFSLMEIPLLAGRGIEEADAAGAPVVAVLSRAAAQSFWPGSSPLGKRIRLLHWNDPLEARVVGVVEDVRQAGPEADVAPAVYFSHRQFADRVLGFSFLVRSDEPAGRLAGAIRARLRALDPDQPVSQLASLDEVLRAALAPRRFNALVVGAFAGLALVLSVIGVHGLVAFLVGERTREIGVRLALGASPAGVRRSFASQGLRLTLAGVALGLPLALAAGRAAAGLVASVSAADPLALAGAAALAVGAGLGAAFFAARRAAALDPAAALREE